MTDFTGMHVRPMPVWLLAEPFNVVGASRSF